MAQLKMARSYEKTVNLKTTDLLTAVKTTCNYEGDLYVDGRLVKSCLGLSRNENTQRLLEYGIASYVNQRSHCWNYRYTDPSKNVTTFFVNPLFYVWDDLPRIDFKILEFRESDNDQMFDSLERVMAFVRETVAASPVQYANLDEDIHVRLFGENGLIYFAPDDWQTEGEPEIYALWRRGGTPEYGAKHYLAKRYNLLQPKLGNYLMAPAVDQPHDPFGVGEVVMLDAPFDSLDKGLYLIREISSDGGSLVFTIGDLDDHEAIAKVSKSQISSPYTS